MLLHTVPKVAPDIAVALGLVGLKLRQRVGHRRPVLTAIPAVRLARLTVQVEQVLVAHAHILGTLAVETRRHITNLDGLARLCMDNHIVGTTHQSLGLTVLIPVVKNDIELLVGTRHQVWSHVNPPQAGTVHLIALVQVEVGLVRR